MAKEYLDKTGLTYLWSKIKDKIIYYGVCSTIGGQPAKEVNCDGFTLYEGARLIVKFTYENTYSWASVTLNVNSTGAKPIKFQGETPWRMAYSQMANSVFMFVYDGTNYEIVGDLNEHLLSSATPIANRISQWDSSKHMNSEDMSTSDVTSFVDSLSGTPIAPAVYCTEVGDSNGWHYKKYSDGYGEAWYRGSKSLAHYNTINGFYAYGYNEINLPFTMANSTYQCDADFLIGNGFAFGTSVRKSTTQLTNLFALATAGGTHTVYLNAHIYGVLA